MVITFTYVGHPHHSIFPMLHYLFFLQEKSLMWNSIPLWSSVYVLTVLWYDSVLIPTVESLVLSCSTKLPQGLTWSKLKFFYLLLSLAVTKKIKLCHNRSKHKKYSLGNSIYTPFKYWNHCWTSVREMYE